MLGEGCASVIARHLFGILIEGRDPGIADALGRTFLRLR